MYIFVTYKLYINGFWRLVCLNERQSWQAYICSVHIYFTTLLNHRWLRSFAIFRISVIARHCSTTGNTYKDTNEPSTRWFRMYYGIAVINGLAIKTVDSNADRGLLQSSRCMQRRMRLHKLLLSWSAFNFYREKLYGSRTSLPFDS